MRGFLPVRALPMAVLVWTTLFLATAAPVWAGASIVFEEMEHHFGKITQGKIVEHRFPFTNQGDSDLVISEVSTPCGCTAVLPDREVVPPGESSWIDLTYDSAARSGEVIRLITVLSNDPEKPELILRMVAQVDASMHEGFSAGEALFGEKCGSCHYDPAKGLIGEELYRKVCWFCHGAERQGKTASALGVFPPSAADYVVNTIANGIPGTEMPGFAIHNGGPLNGAQIDSLLQLMYTEPPPPPLEEEKPPVSNDMSDAAPEPFFK
ncbi:MAG: DUF1573 domain-containing protein [Leptospirillia bacterium]